MKDLFMPVILAVMVIIAGGFFISKIYNPQRQTVCALVDNVKIAQTSIISELDGNGDECTGRAVKGIIQEYGDNVVKVYSKSDNKLDEKNIQDEEVYLKEVIRDENKKIESIIFRIK